MPAQEVKKVGEELGASLTLIRGEELKARGFGGIYGVGENRMRACEELCQTLFTPWVGLAQVRH